MPKESIDIVEVFVDNFIGAINNADLTYLIHLSRCMLHVIIAIFLPYEITQHEGGDSVLEKKQEKGDGTWAYNKEILVWIFNGQYYTLRLSEDKNRKILKHINNIKKFTTKTHIKVMKKKVAFSRHCLESQEGQGFVTYTGCTKRHQPMVAHNTQPNTVLKRLGCDHNTYGEKSDSDPPAGEQADKVHWIFR